MAQRIALTSLILLVLALVGCDHATKVVAQSRLSGVDPVSLVPGLLDLRYVENQDTAFSLTQNMSARAKAPILIGGSILGLVALGFLVRKRVQGAGSLERVALALVLAGGVANVADRVRRGYVVDFIHVQHWPVFNVADILLVVGMILLAYQAYAGRRRVTAS